MPRRSGMSIREVALTIETLAESHQRYLNRCIHVVPFEKQISIQSQLHSPVIEHRYPQAPPYPNTRQTRLLLLPAH